MGVRERVVLHGGRLTLAPPALGRRAHRPRHAAADGQTMRARGAGGAAVRARSAARDRVLRARARRLRPPPRGCAARTSSTPRWPPCSRSAASSRSSSRPTAAARSRPTSLLALGYTVPLAWRRRAPLPATAAVIAAILLMGLTLTPVEQLFVPFAARALAAPTPAAATARRESLAGLALVVVALPLITATMDDRVVADYVFPPLLVAVAWLAGRAVRARTRLTAELHEAAAQLAEASEEEQQLAADRGAPPDRARDARPRRALDERDGRPGRRRAAHPRPRPRPGAGGRDAHRAHRPRGAGRDAPPARRPQRRRPRAALAPQPTLGEIGELVARARAAGPADRPRIPRRAPRPPGGAGPRRLPDRPGRTHQCPQARRPRAHDRDRRLERARAHAGDPRPRRARRAQRRRRAWPRGHARTGAALRRRARGRPGRRRRLARARDAPAGRPRAERWHEHPPADRRRPGARARRVPHDPRRRGRPRGRRRGHRRARRRRAGPAR